MSLDQNALDSLRIERNSGPADPGSSNTYKWFIAAVLLVAATAGAYAFLRTDPIEVQTATAVACSGGPGT